MDREFIDLVSDSDHEAASINGELNGDNEQHVETTATAVHENAARLRESLKKKDWVEVDAENVKDDIDRIYASEGEVWVYKGKGVDPEKNAIKGKAKGCD